VRKPNGHPGLLAFLIDSLKLQEREHVVHVGSGIDYHTVIMAEVVGHRGRVATIEVDHELALPMGRTVHTPLSLIKWSREKYLAVSFEN
jgi:protein-L-isoaspartate O-methyltransferase